MSLKKLTDWIDSQKKAIVDLETLLTSHPAFAPESGGEGELEKCIALEQWLKKEGITDLTRFDAPDGRVKSGIRPNLVATIQGKSDKRSIWVIAHLDVVPVGEISLWSADL